jgi:hypothetical protein
MVSHRQLLQRLRDFINSEFAAQRANLERQWSLPLGERVARGYAIEGLKVEGIEKGTIR